MQVKHNAAMPIAINSEEVLTPPVPSATVMVLRDGDGGLEVLMVRRHGNSEVLGGVYVFPGGKLDAADTRQVSPAHAGERWRDALGEPGLDLPTATGLFVAARRETQEEVALEVDIDALVPWSRWITPRVPSVTNKRFDTRFFAVRLPEGQMPVVDAHEATEAAWLTPRASLTRYWAGAMDLAPPQIMTLAELARFARVDEALAHAAARRPPLVEPSPFNEGGVRVICYPGDPAHSVAAPVWSGPTRLTHRNRRFEPDGGLEALLG